MRPTTEPQLGAALRSRRIAQGMTMLDVACATRGAVPKIQLSYIERGKRSPTLCQLRHIGRVLDLDVIEMIRHFDDLGSSPAPAVQPPGRIHRMLAMVEAVQAGDWDSARDALDSMEVAHG